MCFQQYHRSACLGNLHPAPQDLQRPVKFLENMSRSYALTVCLGLKAVEC